MLMLAQQREEEGTMLLVIELAALFWQPSLGMSWSCSGFARSGGVDRVLFACGYNSGSSELPVVRFISSSPP